MSNPFLDALGWVGSSLDKPGAAVRGLLAGRPEQLANLIPFSDTLGITDPGERTRGTDLLGLDPETTGGMLGGMAAEVATDPLNLLLGAGMFRNVLRGRSLEGAYQAKRAAFPALQDFADSAHLDRLAAQQGERVAQNVNSVRAQRLGSGGMPEEIAYLTTAVDEMGNPVRTYHGTGAVYDKYDPKFDTGANLVGPGYYTSADSDLGSSYAKNLQRRPQTPVEQRGVEEELRRRIGERVAAVGGLDSMEVDPRMLERHAQALAKLPGRRSLPAYMLDDLRTAGVPVEDLGELKTAYTAPHVRTQYLDVRNPFDLEKMHSVEELNALTKAVYGKELYPGGVAHFSEGLPAGTPVAPSPGWDVRQVLRELVAGDLGSSARVPSSPYTPMPEVDAVLNRRLAEGGYDAILHQGGILGGRKHQVYIVPSPEQVYNPWVIPTERALPVIPPPPAYPVYPTPPALPRQSPLLGALGIQNSLGRAG